MERGAISVTLVLLLIHLKFGQSLPRIDLKNPTTLLYKYNDGATLEVSNTPEEKPILKEIIYYHLIERPYPKGEENEKIKKPTNGKRQKRNVYSEGTIPETRPKRAYYRSWFPFSDELSRTSTQHQRDQKAQPSRYSYQVGQPANKFHDEDIEVDEAEESDYDFGSSSDSDMPDDLLDFGPNSSELLEFEDTDEYTDSDGDSSSYAEEGELETDRKPAGASTSSTIDNNKEESGVKTNGTSEDSHKNEIDRKNENLGSIEVDDLECDGEDCNEYGEDQSSSFDNLLNEIHQIFVEENSTIEIPPGTLNNSESFNILNLLDSILKEHSKTNTQTIVVKAEKDQSNFLDSLRGLFTNIVRNNVVVNNNLPVYPKPVDVIGEKDKPEDKPSEVAEKPVTKEPSKDIITTTESPKENVTTNVTPDKKDEISNSSVDSNQIKDNNVTKAPLETTTASVAVTNVTEININKLNDDEPSQATSTTPAMEPETSKGTEKPTTLTPSKIDNNSTVEKEDGAGDGDKNIDYMLDLINNEKFWKFMGDLGGKYLESLMAHTNSVIKEQVDAKIKEHTEALQKLEEKLAAQKEKESEKEDKYPKDDSGNKNKEGKNITENLSIKAHNLFGNTVGNDKVTNVYVFYASEHIDEIIKNIEELANKTKSENTTNIFTFVPKETGKNETVDKLAETITNVTNNKHPINTGNDTKPIEDKTETSTKSNIITEKPVSTTEKAIESTTVSKEKTPEVTTTAVELVPEKSPVTESTEKPTTKMDLPKETPHIDISTTTTVEPTVKDTTIHSTEHSETSTEALPTTKAVIVPETTTSEADKAKTTTESIKPVTQNVILTTESTTTVLTTLSEKTTEITTEQIHETSLTTSTTSVNNNEKSTVTTESIAPITESVTSTTESDLNNTSSTKTEEPNQISTEPSVTTLNVDDNKKDIDNATTENTKLTSEPTTVASTAADQIDSKNNTGSEKISTTESSDQKTDNITTQATTEKAVENSSSTNDQSEGTTEKAEVETTKTEVKDGEMTTEKIGEEKP